MLYVECFADEKLVHSLGVRRRHVRHAKCKREVLNKLRQQPAGIGLVDQDPHAAQPSELKNYREIKRGGGLILLEHRDGSNRWGIILCPRLEEWLYQRAATRGIDPQKYVLPGSAQELKKIPHYETKQQFAEFLQQLRQLDEEMALLEDWLREFTV